jgi:hypothetical protein
MECPIDKTSVIAAAAELVLIAENAWNEQCDTLRCDTVTGWPGHCTYDYELPIMQRRHREKLLHPPNPFPTATSNQSSSCILSLEVTSQVQLPVVTSEGGRFHGWYRGSYKDVMQMDVIFSFFFDILSAIHSSISHAAISVCLLGFCP